MQLIIRDELMLSVLFVCTGNTCRSVMAEALTKRRFSDKIEVSSAGLRPQQPQDAAKTIETLKTHFGIDASGHIPRNVHDFTLDNYDFVVAMDKYVDRQLKQFSKSNIIVWNIDDPYGEDLLEYKRCALMIMREVNRLPIVTNNPPSRK